MDLMLITVLAVKLTSVLRMGHALNVKMAQPLMVKFLAITAPLLIARPATTTRHARPVSLATLSSTISNAATTA